MEIAPFQNRQMEVQQITSDEYLLLNICGESGIGKTRLLTECREKLLGEHGNNVLILFIDLADLPGEGDERVKALLKVIISSLHISGVWNSNEQVSGLLIHHINGMAQTEAGGSSSFQPVMMFDTTEAVKDDPIFWKWMENCLVRPLLNARNTKLIFAGRSPVHWKDFEVRRLSEKPMRLEPLSSTASEDSPAYRMAADLLAKKGIEAVTALKYGLISLVLKLSFGHPRLIEDLVAYLAEHLPEKKPEAEIETELSKQVVEPFIETKLLKQIDDDWKPLIWWMSVLQPFDIPILHEYLNEVAHLDPIVEDKVTGKPEYFYMQGINALHSQSIIVWKENEGEQFQGAVGQIIALCFSMIRPSDYVQANQAAARVARQFYKVFLKDEPDLRAKYKKQEETYQSRAVQYQN